MGWLHQREQTFESIYFEFFIQTAQAGRFWLKLDSIVQQGKAII